MTDKETLLAFRLRQAEETLDDARKMLNEELSPRSIANRAYYCMFYAALALFLASDIQIKTSKHAGIISIFDREFAKTGKIEKRFSEMLHVTFNARLEADYQEMVELSLQEALEYVRWAEDFLKCIKEIIAAK